MESLEIDSEIVKNNKEISQLQQSIEKNKRSMKIMNFFVVFGILFFAINMLINYKDRIKVKISIDKIKYYQTINISSEYKLNINNNDIVKQNETIIAEKNQKDSQEICKKEENILLNIFKNKYNIMNILKIENAKEEIEKNFPKKSFCDDGLLNIEMITKEKTDKEIVKLSQPKIMQLKKELDKTSKSIEEQIIKIEQIQKTINENKIISTYNGTIMEININDETKNTEIIIEKELTEENKILNIKIPIEEKNIFTNDNTGVILLDTKEITFNIIEKNESEIFYEMVININDPISFNEINNVKNKYIMIPIAQRFSLNTLLIADIISVHIKPAILKLFA